MSEIVTPLRRRGRPSASGAEAGGDVQSLDRAIGLLEVLANSDGLGLSEAARQAELPPSTVHRLLATLHRRGLVNQEADSGHWTVGVGLFRIGSAYMRIRKLPEIARPIIRALLAEVNETINVSMLDGHEVVCVAQAESHAAVRAFFRLGQRLPLHASAAGKAILASGSDPFRQALLDGSGYDRFTDRTLTSRKAFLAEVARVGERGYAIDDEEHTPGMRCVAAAIRNEHAEPVGAVSVSAPAVRMPAERIEALGARVADTAATLTTLYAGLRR